MEANISKTSLWTSRIMRWIVILFMLFDGIIKFIKPDVVIQSTMQLGYKEHHILVHGLTSLIPTILFMIPRTTVLGAILMTAHLGGAVATHLRIDNPLFSHMLFPVYVGVLAWGSIWLRDERVRGLVPVVNKSESSKLKA